MSAGDDHTCAAHLDGTLSCWGSNLAWQLGIPRIVLSVTSTDGQDIILVSADRGATFTEYMTIGAFAGIAFAPDGRVWIGDRGPAGAPETAGIWSASSLDEAPSRFSDVPVRCLAYGVGGVLYACKALEFGEVDVSSGAFTSLFSFVGATGLLECDGVDMAATCEEQLCTGYCGPGHFSRAPLCCVYDDPLCGPALVSPDEVQCEGYAPPDGGRADGGAPGADAGDPRASAPAADGGCSCSSTPTPVRAPLWAVVALSSLWLMRRRRA